MKLKEKISGEEVEIDLIVKDKHLVDRKIDTIYGKKITAKNFSYFFEDYEEPKEYWHIVSMCAGLQKKKDTDNGEDSFNKEIGNKFETEEEGEKAVEKLKAWKRLENKGLKFDSTPCCDNLCGNGFEIHFSATMPPEAWNDNNVRKDLDLLFCTEVKNERTKV